MNDDVTRANESSARLREAFDVLIELAPPERRAWLDSNVSDARERNMLQRLLDADDSGGYLDTPAAEHAARLAAEEITPGGLIGRQIGTFKVLAELGQGGMSAVFLGARVGADFEQRVAIKLLRRGLYSELEQRLFLRERRVLAALDHANIARLIDGGVTEAGVPYLVMEFVDGVAITRYVQLHGLDVQARLRLFLTVCRAVAAAHRNLIVHRDIKPSNILVSNDGVVKLLDFGIAKLIEEGDDTQATGTVGVFTPDYAAPEQIAGEAITTATDVYGLGVLLHEMLLGIRPTGTPTRRPSSLIPTRAATVIRGDDTGIVYPVAPARLRSLLRGDLDNVLMKALASEPTQRYVTAAAFADDIERYLNRKPVHAHPPSRLYRARKFVQRHRGGVAITALFVLALVGLLGVTLWQARIARNEAQRANATRDFMVDLFQTASEDVPRDQRPTPAQLVQEAAKRAREDDNLAEPVRAQLLFMLGKVALANGEYAEAEKMLNEAIVRDRALGIDTSSSEWLDLLVQKGNLLQRTNRNNEADTLMSEVKPLLLSQDSEGAVSGLMLLGATRAYGGHADEAVAIAQQAARKAERVFGADSVNGIETLTYLGQLCTQVHRYREGIALLEPAIARWHKLKLPEDDQLARTLLHLASAKEHVNARAEVEPIYRDAIGLMRRIYSVPHDRLATGLGSYARFLIGEERYDEAQAALDEALAIDIKVLGAEHARSAVLVDTRALLEHARHDDARAEASAADAVQKLAARSREAGFAPELTLARLHLAEIALGLGHLDDAAAQLAQASGDLPATFGADSAEAAEAAHVAARLQLARGDAAAAQAQAERGLVLAQKLDPAAPRAEIALRETRAAALAAQGKHAAAAAELSHALDVSRASQPQAHVLQSTLLAQRAREERALGNATAAAASIDAARALAVPAALLSSEDRATLQSR